MPMPASDKSKSLSADERSERVSRVIEDCILRRAGGETISDQSLIDAHSALMPELAEELRRLSIIQAGLRLAEAQSRDGTRFVTGCPECGNPVQVDASDSELNEVACPSCGAEFKVSTNWVPVGAGSR